MRDRIADYFEITAGGAFDVPSEEAAEYFRAKGLKAAFSYADVTAQEHAAAFTVAKMMDMDLLLDMQKSLDEALSSGVLFREWAEDIIPMLQEKGWWGRKEMRDPITGKVIVAQLGSPRRLETIFRTNLQTAYSAGKWQQIMDQADIAPYLMYDAVDDFRTRAQHKAWDNKVLPATDKFWRSHYPPNGWGCRCGVIQLSDDDLEEMGLSVDPSPRIKYGPWTNPRTGRTEKVPDGVDPGFNYNPGQARYDYLRNLAQEKVKALPPNLEDAAKEGIKAADKAAKEAAKPIIDTSTPAGRWHAVSWNSAPDWLMQVVVREQSVNVSTSGDGAWARGGELVNMSYLEYVNDEAFSQTVWRHEFGHILDFRLGGGKYISAGDKFTASMHADADTLKKSAGVGQSKAAKAQAAKRAARPEDVRRTVVDLLGDAQRIEYLQGEARAVGLDIDELVALIRSQSDVSTDGISGRVRVAQIIDAIKHDDPERFVYEVVDFGGDSFARRENFRRGAMAMLSDLIGAATKNALAGHAAGYFGHKTAYYNQLKGYGQQVECFANLTVLASSTPTLWAITKRFFPLLTETYEGLVRD